MKKFFHLWGKKKVVADFACLYVYAGLCKSSWTDLHENLSKSGSQPSSQQIPISIRLNVQFVNKGAGEGVVKNFVELCRDFCLSFPDEKRTL